MLVLTQALCRFSAGPAGMNRRLVHKYADIFTRMNAAIIPHTCEHLWSNILKREGSVMTAGWPEVPVADPTVAMASTYIEAMIPSFRKAVAKAEAPPKAKKGQPAPPTPPKVTKATIYVADKFVGWQETVLKVSMPCVSRQGALPPRLGAGLRCLDAYMDLSVLICVCLAGALDAVLVVFWKKRIPRRPVIEQRGGGGCFSVHNHQLTEQSRGRILCSTIHCSFCDYRK